MVRIQSVEKNSLAEKAGIKAGDFLVSVDCHPIRDVLDYRFFITEPKIHLLLSREGQAYEADIRKAQYADIGLEFESFLMDEKRCCANKCVFCFVDQNPKGMRESIYFKDDDTRLSFLMGNYVTLTNTGSRELCRLVEMHITPVNVSVHTTNPELRVKMLGNKTAGNILEKLSVLAKGGISLNCQIVLCRGLNDGAELDRTLRELSELGESVLSIAVVPAGLTCHREGLYPLESFDRETAGAVILQVERFQKAMLEARGSRLCYCSDEFFITAGFPIPAPDYYEGYPQLDNGVGMFASDREDLDWELEALADSEGKNQVLSEKLRSKKDRVLVLTGTAAADFLAQEVHAVISRLNLSLSARVVACENRFFGGKVTVAGLLTGSDILAACKNINLGEFDRILLPEVMLRREKDRFLDDITPAELSERLGLPLSFSGGGKALIEALTGEKI